MIAALTLPVALDFRAGRMTLRRARPDDLDALMALLADDPISAGRGDLAAAEDLPAYRRALETLIEDAANEVVVAEDGTGRVLGTSQLTVIPGMARRGATRLLIEAVRVAATHRSAGIGAAMMRWVVAEAAPAVGAGMVQLTSDAARVDAHRFYERLGFVPSHVGFKLSVSSGAGHP